MIKSFGQWRVVKDGIETAPGCEYFWISKKDIMNKNTAHAEELKKLPNIHYPSLVTAFGYAYKYFHAMTKYTMKSHPEVYEAMMDEFNELQWHESENGFTAETSEGFNISVFRHNNEKWKWVYDDIFSGSSYKSMETAKKKAYSSFYWLHKHIKNGDGSI